MVSKGNITLAFISELSAAKTLKLLKLILPVPSHDKNSARERRRFDMFEAHRLTDRLPFGELFGGDVAFDGEALFVRVGGIGRWS